MAENVNTSALSFESAEEESDNRETMIKVDHVSMVFNMASEQLNNLKEYAIKLARRELFFEGFKALDDVSFEVKRGDVFGVMGTNGSGKSTILKIIAGVLEPSEGTCEINGRIAPLIELGAGFDMELTARENIYLNGALLGYSKDFINEHFQEIVEFAEVESFLDMPLKNYSSGMVARIAFAIATVIVPDILIVDEVLSVGDFMFQKKCEDRINDLIEKYGVTVLIVSHSNDQIARMCNKAIWIEKGHTRMMGDAKKVAHTYGALGGRTGSKESEKKVFDALVRAEDVSVPEGMCAVIEGDDACSTNAKLVMRGWDLSTVDTLVLVSDATHANAVVATPLAGAYDAPVLSCKADRIPDCVERVLCEAKPSRILALSCEGFSLDVESFLHSLAWNPEVVFFVDSSLEGFCGHVFRFGVDHDLWDAKAALIGFDDNLESLVACPYLYDRKMPVVMLPSGVHSFDGLGDLLDTLSGKELLAIGPSAAKAAKESSAPYANADLLGFGADGACFEISSFIRDFFETEKGKAEMELCLSAYAMGQWPALLSCGSYAGKNKSPLFLVDGMSLDSMVQCLGFVEKRRNNISRLTFVGGKAGLSLAERMILCGALAGE